VRVTITEDSGFFRSALTDALESSGVTVVASTDNVTDLMKALERADSDVSLVDICLPPTKTDEGLRAAETIKVLYPDMGVLVLSAHLETPHVSRLLNSNHPGLGCLSKDQLHDVDLLIEALRRVASGGTFIDPEFVDQRFRLDAMRDLLTLREMDILRSLAEGRSNQGIAERHNISVKTVESTVTTLFRKLGLESTEGNSRVQAALAFLGRPRSFTSNPN
jgi:DNA-binding NarL/FixJ family response regulator